MEYRKLKKALIREEFVVLTGSFEQAVILNQFLYCTERVKDFDNWIVVIKRDSQGKIMASARYFKKNDTIEVGRLMVAPSFRNQGLAFSIMKNVEDHSRGSKFELFTCTRSWINIRLYEKLGYRIFKEGIDDNELPLAYMEKCINENT